MASDSSQSSVSFFQPTSVLVTGAAGFIMSHVVDELLRTFPETKVICYDKLTYCSNEKNMNTARSLGGDRFVFVKGDILNLDHVKHVLHQHQVDAVIAGAAETHVDLSLSQSIDFTQTNVMGTHLLLEAVRQYQKESGQKLKRYIHVSTDEVIDYGDEKIPADEKANLFASSPYAASKAAAELICSGYRHSYHIPLIITREITVPLRIPVVVTWKRSFPSLLHSFQGVKSSLFTGQGPKSVVSCRSRTRLKPLSPCCKRGTSPTTTLSVKLTQKINFLRESDSRTYCLRLLLVVLVVLGG